MKTAIVTGAAGNLGQAVVRKFLAEGFRVIGTMLPNESGKLNIGDAPLEMIALDLMIESDVQAFVDRVITKYGTVDILVATVGGFIQGKISETTTADLDEQMNLNFKTAYHIARPAFLHMLKNNWGRIFFVGSRPGLSAEHGKGMIAYGLSKSLVFRLAELMNAEAKGTNVVSSVIVPSTINTESNRLAMPGADFNSWVKAEAIADVIHFYCSPAADSLRSPVIKVYHNA